MKECLYADLTLVELHAKSTLNAEQTRVRTMLMENVIQCNFQKVIIILYQAINIYGKSHLK